MQHEVGARPRRTGSFAGQGTRDVPTLVFERLWRQRGLGFLRAPFRPSFAEPFQASSDFLTLLTMVAHAFASD